MTKLPENWKSVKGVHYGISYIQHQRLLVQWGYRTLWNIPRYKQEKRDIVRKWKLAVFGS